MKNYMRISMMLIAMMCCCTAFCLEKYDEASEKYIKEAQTAIARFDQTTSDGYNYIYWVYFNAPVDGSKYPTITIDNPSLDAVTYTVTRAAGSMVRKELWCTDPQGNQVSIIFKIEEMPGARNATVLKMYVDKYPGKRANQKSIDATAANNLYEIKKTYAGASILFSKTNSRVSAPKQFKANIYPTLLDWMNVHYNTY